MRPLADHRIRVRFDDGTQGDSRLTALFHELDTVVLLRDLPEAGLRSGDLGAIVQVYGGEALEVEFVTASGRTQALLTLPVSDVRPVRDDDLLAVRTSPLGDLMATLQVGARLGPYEGCFASLTIW